MQIPDTLAYLTGSWELERTIADHRTGETGCFQGRADVHTRGRRGRYQEQGVLRLGSYQASARRALQLMRTDGAAVAVSFGDGRPFFALDLATGSCAVVHPCRLDRYELEFEVASSDLLVERWRVTRPAKDYAAQTTWRRR